MTSRTPEHEKPHEVRMAQLGDRHRDPCDALRDALAYCNDLACQLGIAHGNEDRLAAQLEAERSAHAATKEKLRYWEHHPVENVNRELRAANARQTERVRDAEGKIVALEKERDEAHGKGRRSGYIATVTALQNAFRPGVNIDEHDPDKVIARVVALIEALRRSNDKYAEDLRLNLDSLWEALQAKQAAFAKLQAAERVIRYIENLVSDDLTHDLEARIHASETPDPTMTESEVRIVERKLSAIYRATHSHVPGHSCHHVHQDWRDEVAKWKEDDRDGGTAGERK